MAKVTIRGKEFPLCLTVAALDKVNEKWGSLNGFLESLKGDEINSIAQNTAWALAVLMEEGEENRLLCARLDGEKAERQQVPGTEDILHILTPGAVGRCRVAVLTAVNESMRQDIEAEHSKNADHAE